MTDRDRDAFGHIRLAPVGRSKVHRRGGVEQEPRDEHALREIDADVRLTGACGDVPVDAAHVVARHVRTKLRKLGAVTEARRPVVAREHALQPANDVDLQRAEGF